mmetsp:Transcript_3503/g.9079  ORF Transcript_3503/g.9079 Transcript_3503/m.9079 type:complete len:120 (+) Transcript_3503:121-480(+)
MKPNPQTMLIPVPCRPTPILAIPSSAPSLRVPWTEGEGVLPLPPAGTPTAILGDDHTLRVSALPLRVCVSPRPARKAEAVREAAFGSGSPAGVVYRMVRIPVARKSASTCELQTILEEQ